jgi:hypothetical protein
MGRAAVCTAKEELLDFLIQHPLCIPKPGLGGSIATKVFQVKRGVTSSPRSFGCESVGVRPHGHRRATIVNFRWACYF